MKVNYMRISVNGLNFNEKCFSPLRNSVNAYRGATNKVVDYVLDTQAELRNKKQSVEIWENKKNRLIENHDISILGGIATIDTEEKALAYIAEKIKESQAEVTKLTDRIAVFKATQKAIIDKELSNISDDFVEKFMLLDKDPFNEVYVSDCKKAIADFFGKYLKDTNKVVTIADVENLYNSLVGISKEKSNNNIRTKERLTKISIGSKARDIRETFYSFLSDFVLIDFMDAMKWTSKVVEKAKKKSAENEKSAENTAENEKSDVKKSDKKSK